MKVYMIKGCGGDYEDYREWIVYATNSFEKCIYKRTTCYQQYKVFCTAMRYMHDEYENYDDNEIDYKTPTEYDKFCKSFRYQAYQILTEDVECREYEYGEVTYRIDGIEVDVED